MIARLALVAALVGSAAGATAVLAAGESAPPPSKPPTVVAAPAKDPAPTPVALEVRDVRLVLQVPDPEGGAPWAARRFASSTPGRRGRPATPLECWELGRLQGDQFGWIDGYGGFTARAPGRFDVPNLCASPKSLRKQGALPTRFTTVTYPAGRAPQPTRAVTWGVASEAIAAVVPDGEPPIAIGPEQVFIRVAAAQAPPGVFKGSKLYRDGTRRRFELGGQIPVRPGTEKPIAGTEAVAAQAPDPAGGEPWGIVVQRGRRGGLCHGIPDRLVGNQLGYVDPRLDTFMTGFGFGIACDHAAPTRRSPLRLDALISGVRRQGEDRGRIERRTQDTRIVYWGRAHADVVSVTIRTPRDVRTLIPTKDFHMFLAVYDGLFPGGKATLTARMRDGREVTRSLHVE
jgi:hypothetical protein